MGYIRWHYAKSGSMFLTWWAFFGPELKRDVWKVFFRSVGVAFGYLIARLYVIPERMLGFYDLNTDA